MPRASPAATGFGPFSRQSRAKPRHMNATMGTSVPPTHSSNAMTGDAVISRAQRAQSLAPAIRNAAANTMRNTTPNHTRGSVSRPWPNSACGTPKAAISGRYGLYWLGSVVVASTLGLLYGVPWWISVLAEVATTPTSGSPCPVATIHSSGTRMAPQMMTPSAMSTPKVARDRQASTARAATA
ncbi:MAG TPA: hypothetical protein VHO07_08605 [Streptosporangiaceae bacterium]|nr:hypothetical protein [Streptosporangiaceae bacterium]